MKMVQLNLDSGKILRVYGDCIAVTQLDTEVDGHNDYVLRIEFKLNLINGDSHYVICSKDIELLTKLHSYIEEYVCTSIAVTLLISLSVTSSSHNSYLAHLNTKCHLNDILYLKRRHKISKKIDCAATVDIT